MKFSNYVIYFVIILVISCSTIDYVNLDKKHPEKSRNQKDEISLVTYNIKAIYDKEDGQIDTVMHYLNRKKFDFVLLQELFDESTRDEIMEKSDSFYSTIISRVDYNSFPELIFQDAGLYMMSDYPRIDLSGIEFGGDIKNSNGIVHRILDKEISKTNDFLANKSVMGTLFAISDSTRLFLFNTHVQAIGRWEHKLYQMEQIHDFISKTVIKVISSGLVSAKNLIVILAGDFNNNAYRPDSHESMLKKLGYPRDLHMEFNGNKQEYTFRFRSGRGSRRFDYILAYDKLGDYQLRKISTKSINVKDLKDNQNRDISDHSALKAVIKINLD